MLVACFTIISTFVVTARVSLNNVRADLFLKGRISEFSLHGDWKITVRIQNFKDANKFLF